MLTIPAKTIVTRTKKPAAWFGAEYNMNIYRGCSHGCIYCDSRSDCYRNTDFDTVKVKDSCLCFSAVQPTVAPYSTNSCLLARPATAIIKIYRDLIRRIQS